MKTMKNLVQRLGLKVLVCGVSVAVSAIGAASAIAADITYETHLAFIGWQNPVKNGQMAGTVGEGRQMEAIKITQSGLPASCKLQYKVHAAFQGWTNWLPAGSTAGSTGQGRQLEAIQIQLDNCPGWNVEYQVHAAFLGWSPWQSDGEIAGSTGQGRQIEAIRIRLKEN